MVAIVAGNGLGLFNTSLNVSGAVWGRGTLGQAGGRVFVNVSTGNLVMQAVDEQLSARGHVLQHLRTYNAKGALNDGDADQWRWDGERRLALSGTLNAVDSTVTRTTGDGHESVYRWDAATSRYVGYDGSGAHDTITYSGNEFIWTDGSSRMEERYAGSSRRLKSRTDSSGNRIDFTFDAAGRLLSVRDDASKQKLVLSYESFGDVLKLRRVETYALQVDASERATATLGPAIKQVEYDYDALGRLKSVASDLNPLNTTDNTVYVTSYTYDGASTRIDSVTQSDGSSASFTYDQETGHVLTVTDASGTQRFSYGANRTDVTDASGQVWSFLYDGDGQLTELIAPAPAGGGARPSTKYFYDGQGNLTQVVDARGNAVTYEYDSQGNRTLERDALGHSVERTYDSKNQVVTESRYKLEADEVRRDLQTTRYVYDGQSRLRFVVSAEGRVSESRYGTATSGYGQLTRTLKYADERYDLSALVPTEGLTENQLIAWLDRPSLDKRQVEQSQFDYDLRGNLSRRIDFASSTADGVGVLDAAASITEYIYSGHGELLHAISVRGVGRDRRTTMSSTVYDGMGRELQTIDAGGTRTTVYDDANRKITVTTGAGLVVTRSYDVRGRLLSVIQSGDGVSRQTQYVYDTAGRLRMVQDAQGTRRFNFYDAQGRLQYEVDGTGAVTSYAYNANGQLTAQVRHLDRIDSTESWYDAASNTVTKQTLTVGGAGSDVVTDPRHDRATSYDYDAAGRLEKRTDAANVVTETTYDGVSRIATVKSGDRVTRYIYDRDGRQVGVVDALGFLTENRFDAAGRLVQSVRYSGRGPMASSAGAPVWTGVNDRSATGGRPFEYRLPAAYDPEGARIVYSIQGPKPSWLNFDPVSLTLSGTPPTGLTSYVITLRAADGTESNANSTDVAVRITVGNSAPSWGELPDSRVAANATGYSLILPPATDVESAAGQLTYSVVNPALLPPGITFDPVRRELRGVPTVPGTYTVTMQVSDGQLTTQRSFTIQVTNNGPTWAPVENKTGWRNTPMSFSVPPALDPEGQPLTYRVVSKPAWLTFNAGQLSGTPPALGLAQEVVLEATDPSGETVRLAFSVDIVNRAPGWSSLPDPPDRVAGYAFSYLPPAATDADGEALTYSATGLPPGLIVNPTTGAITGTSNQVGNFTVVLTATDASGASVQRSIVIRLHNAPPVYSGGLGNRTIDGGTDVVISLAGTFVDPNGDALGFGLIHAPSWLTYDHATKTLRGRAPNRNETASVGVVASDAHGANAHHAFSITVAVQVSEPPPPPPPRDPEDPTPLPRAVPSEGNTGKVGAVDNHVSSPTLLADLLAAWRPTASSDDLHSYHYYDGRGRLVGTVDERGYLTETVYDEQTHQQQTRRYTDRIVVAADGTLDRAKEQAGPLQQTTTVEFDGFGRLSKRTDVDGTVSRLEYDSAGRLVREVRAAGTTEQRATRTRFNAFGEVTGTLGGVGESALAGDAGQDAIDAAMASHGMRYQYDSAGRQVRAIDANGNATLFYYDREGRLSHTVNARGEVSSTVYNSFGQAETMRRYGQPLAADVLAGLSAGTADAEFLGHVDALALADVQVGRDRITSYEYDQRGLLTKQTDGEGFVTTNFYNAYGELHRQERAIAAGRSVTTQYGYDLRGQLQAQSGDVGGINFNARFEYDAFGRVVRSVDGAGKVVATNYLEGGRIIEVTDALDRMRRTEYDAFGRVCKQVDALGRTTSYAYIDVSRSVTVTTPEGVTVTTTRSPHGQTLTVTDGRNKVTAYEYDKDGRLTKVTDARGQVVSQTSYDNSGRVSSTTDARGVRTTLEYDALNRVVKRVVDPSTTSPAHSGLDLTTLYEFDEFGGQLRTTEGYGSSSQRVTEYRYDRKGQLTQVIVDPAGLKLSTRFSFDGLGNTVTVERGTEAHPSQQVTVYEFDSLGRRTKEIAAPSSVFGAGSARERNLTTEYRYDAAGRVSRVIDALGQSTWYGYDAAGQRTHTVNALGEVSQSWYDANGRVVQHRQYVTRLSDATLAGLGDAIGSGIPVTANSADRRSHTVYDSDGRLRYKLEAATSGAWVVSESRYDGNGNVVESRRYDKYLTQERLDAIDTNASPGVSVAEVAAELTALLYDESDGSLVNIQRTRFAYDANNRLRFTVDALGSVREQVYDVAGNLIRSVSYARRPPLAQFTEAAIDGAVIRSDSGNRITHFAYDAAGRLRYSAQVLSEGAHLVSRQEYDSLGRLVRTTAFRQPIGPLADYSTGTLDGAVSGSIGTDAGNRTSAFAYDSAGRQVYTVRVLTGTEQLVSKLEYDVLGRVTRSTAYETPVGALADYSLSSIDAAVTASPRDRSTSFVYDAVGRQRFTVAADGALSERVYDALGRVIETRSFDLRVSASTLLTDQALSARRADRAVGDGVTRGEKYGYDKAGRLLTTTDALGYVESYEYDGLGNRRSYTNKTAHKWTYAYNRLGQMTSQYAPAVLMQFEGESQPTARSLETRSLYDAFGNLTDRYEAFGTSEVRRTQFVYDRAGRRIESYEPGWYDPDTGRVEKADAEGRFRRKTEFSYDALGQVVRTSVRSGAAGSDFVHQYRTYDALGRLEFEVDALNHVTRFGYTTFGEQSLVLRHSLSVGAPPAPDRVWSSATLAGVLAGDQSARVITIVYDNLGRKTQVTQPTAASYYHAGSNAAASPPSISPVTDTAVTRYEYTVFGELQRESIKIDGTGANGRWRDTWHYYDAMGRQERSIDALGHHTARSYDALGNLKEIIEYAVAGASGSSLRSIPDAPPPSADDRISAFAYDARNLRVEIQRKNLRYAQQSGSGYGEVSNSRLVGTVVARMGYDGEGRLVTTTDALNNLTTTEYNALGQVIKVTEPARVAAAAGSVHNDPFLNPVAATKVTTMVLDAFGQVVTRIIGPGNGGAGSTLTTRRRYDVGGHLVASVDARGHETSFKVDYAGRVIRQTQAINVTLGSWQTVSHTLERRITYDAAGRQIAAVEMFMNGPTQMQSGQRQHYNAFGEVEHEDRIWGEASAALGSLQAVRVASYEYDRAGHLSRRTASDGITRYYYNLAGQVTRQEQTGDGGAMRISETWFDDLGRARLSRLPSFSARRTGSSSAEAITPISEQSYDRWGNVISRSQGAYVRHAGGLLSNAERRTTTYRYNHDNLVIAEVLPQVEATRADGSTYVAAVSRERRYDLLGRAVQEFESVNGDATPLRMRSKEYNAAGQLVAQTDATGNRTEYAYDVHGNRVATRNALGTVFVDQFDENGNIVAHGVLRQPGQAAYVSGSGQPSILRMLNRYQYDEANRRVASADVMHPMEVSVDWSYTEYDARGFMRAQRNPSGVIVGYDYDALGFKVREYDAAGNDRRWDYSVGSDGNDATEDYDFRDSYRLGLLRYSSFSGGAIAYAYNGFGQLTSQTVTGFGRSDESLYAYHDNGLLKSRTDQLSFGTRGVVGGADYWATTDVLSYEYTVNGQRSHESFTRDARKEAFGAGPDMPLLPTSDSLTRSSRISYDALGRMTNVQSVGSGTAALNSLTYRYDEFGNRRNIVATYRDAQGNSGSSDQWYTYDDEGRMLIVDGTLQGSQIKGGTKLTYDALGRRRTSEKWIAASPVYDNLPDEPGTTRQWQEYREERYNYNDLGHMTLIEQRLNRRDGTVTRPGDTGPTPVEGSILGQFVNSVVRGYDDRGAVMASFVYSDIRSIGISTVSSPNLLTVTNSSYRADGRLYQQHTYDERDSQRNSIVTNTYDSAGRLKSYTFQVGAPNSPDSYSDTYTYSYSSGFGGPKESRIDVTSTRPGASPGHTVNNYDARGNLVSQSVINSSTTRARSFAYDGDGHIITKTENVQGDVQSTGSQSFFYVNGRQVASIGGGSLAGVNFSSDYEPVNAIDMGGPGSYVVMAGDTLATIARAVYGDSALWYLIADANSIGGGPDELLASSEIGKTYRAPEVQGSRNSASTFRPYDPASIIGNGTPTADLPTPGGPQCAAQVGLVLKVVVVTAIAVAATVMTAGVAAPAGPIAAGAIAGASGAMAGQSAAIGMGLQDTYDGKQILGSMWSGAFSAAVSRGAESAGVYKDLTASDLRVAGAVQSAAIDAIGGVATGGGTDWGRTLGSLGAKVTVEAAVGEYLSGLDTKRFAWGSALGSVAVNAVNPHNGWVMYDHSRDWVHIAGQATNAFASVAVEGLSKKLKAEVDARGGRSDAGRVWPDDGNQRFAVTAHAARFGGAGAAQASGAVFAEDGIDPGTTVDADGNVVGLGEVIHVSESKAEWALRKVREAISSQISEKVSELGRFVSYIDQPGHRVNKHALREYLTDNGFRKALERAEGYRPHRDSYDEVVAKMRRFVVANSPSSGHSPAMTPTSAEVMRRAAVQSLQDQLILQMREVLEWVRHEGAFASIGRTGGLVAGQIAGKDDATAFTWAGRAATVGGMVDGVAPVPAVVLARRRVHSQMNTLTDEKGHNAYRAPVLNEAQEKWAFENMQMPPEVVAQVAQSRAAHGTLVQRYGMVADPLPILPTTLAENIAAFWPAEHEFRALQGSLIEDHNATKRSGGIFEFGGLNALTPSTRISVTRNKGETLPGSDPSVDTFGPSARERLPLDSVPRYGHHSHPTAFLTSDPKQLEFAKQYALTYSTKDLDVSTVVGLPLGLVTPQGRMFLYIPAPLPHKPHETWLERISYGYQGALYYLGTVSDPLSVREPIYLGPGTAWGRANSLVDGLGLK